MSKLESEKLLQQLKYKTERIWNEAQQIEKENERLRQERKRLINLNSSMDA